MTGKSGASDLGGTGGFHVVAAPRRRSDHLVIHPGLRGPWLNEEPTVSTPYLIVPPGYRRYIDAHNDAAHVCIAHQLQCDPADLLVPRRLFGDGPECLFPYIDEDLILPRRTAIHREARARILGESATRRCTYCMRGALRPGETWAIDHRLPVKLGGASPHWNLTLACSTCNAMKGVALWEPGHNLGLSLRLATETSDSHPTPLQTSFFDLLAV